MEAVYAFMMKLGALTVAGMLFELAMPKGGLRESARRATGLIALLCSVEFIVALIGELG